MNSKWVRPLLVALVAMVASAPQLQGQTGTVRGRAIDANLVPLVGATVTVADRSGVTEAGGYFVVTDVPAGVHTLRATLIGYRPFEVEVRVLAGQDTDVAVEMVTAPLEMAPIVAVGYGTQETRDLTGSVSDVPAGAFNTGRLASPEELIRGKAAGVQVTETNGGDPGGGISVRIRGGTSITNSNEPLYVIDGVPISVGGGTKAECNIVGCHPCV